MIETLELPKARFGDLIRRLKDRGYTVIGPTLGDGAIIYDEIGGVEDLPRGWIDEQDAGRYHLARSDRDYFFDFVVGPHSWKRYLFPPRLTLLRVTRTESDLRCEQPALQTAPGPMAFLGVRACELAAIDIQDAVFIGGPFVEQHYKLRRDQAFLVAVNCLRPGGTCFCVSMKTGPRAEKGFDLALTEFDDVFMVEVGTPAGRAMLDGFDLAAASTARRDEAETLLAAAARRMGRQLDTSDLPQLLLDRLEHPRWKEVAERCLSCTNCTMVCPTCFCSDVEEVDDLRLESSERVRVWDSCFSQAFSYVHGGTKRPNIHDRYRQWLTHKLATWHQQFGTSGCVGCGRCITWCPPGIDITEEVAAIRGTPVGETTL